MRRSLFLLPLILLFSLTAKAQIGARFDGVVLSNTGTPVAGASVQVCTQPATGTPCSPIANVYADVNLTIQIPNPLTTDMNGNYFGYVQGGIYTIEYFGAGLVDKQLPDQTITLPLTANPTFLTITLDGATSGSIVLQPAAVAGTNTITFPAFTGNVLIDTAAQSVSGKTFAQNIVPDAAGSRTIGTVLLPYSSVFIGGSATNNIDLTGTATASRTATLPDNTGTIAELNLAQTWSSTQTFPSASLVPGEISPGSNGQCIITSGGATQWGTCTGVTGANVSLSNLSAVAINTALFPGSAGLINLGSTALPFENIYLGAAANATLNFNVAGLSTNRTATWPDASGTVGFINVNQTWSGVPNFADGFEINSSAALTNVSGNGTHVATAASSLTSASPGTPTCADGNGNVTVTSCSTPTIPASVQTFCSTSISGTVSISSAGTTVTSVACTMPSTGCPCRALISYSLYLTFSATEQAIAFWVQDGTNVMAGTQTAASNGTSGGKTSATYSGFSPVTYSNSANITFTMKGQDTASTGSILGSPTTGSGPNSSMQIAIFTSN